MATTIEVSDETWKALNRRKEPGQTFDDVVGELIENKCGRGQEKNEQERH